MVRHHVYSVSTPKSVGFIKKSSGGVIFKTENDADSGTKAKEKNEPRKVAFWGDGNDFPQRWEEEIRKNTTLQGALEIQINETYAGGLEAGTIVDGKWKTYDGPDKSEIQKFLESPHTLLWFEQAIRDYWYHRLPVPKILFTQGKTKAFVSSEQAVNLRWELRNKKNGLIEYAYLSRYWADGDSEESEFCTKLPTINPLWHTQELIKAESSTAYIYQVPMASSEAYYAFNPAYSAKLQGVLDVANDVILWKKSLLKRLTTQQYIIYIYQDYFEKKYNIKIGTTKASEVNRCLASELEHINTMISGTENAGGNIITTQWYEEMGSGKMEKIRAWEMEALKGDTLSGVFNEDMSEADTHTTWAVGIDITTLGSKNSSGYSAGSGSDKKASFNSRMSVKQRVATCILSPLYWLKNYNGWDEELKYRIRLPYISDDNAVSPDKRNNQDPQDEK